MGSGISKVVWPYDECDDLSSYLWWSKLDFFWKKKFRLFDFGLRSKKWSCFFGLVFFCSLKQNFYYRGSWTFQLVFLRTLFFAKNKKHTALTIPVWSPTTVLGEPNPAWLRSSDGIRYIQGGMTVWYKSYFFITLISPWIYHCPSLFFTKNSIPESAMNFLAIFSLLLFQ